MEKIHLIMPMGGGGTRFGNKGFNLPKPLIELQGKPFFYWAVQSILKFIDVQDIIFVVLKEHVELFEIDKVIKSFYPDALIHVIPHVLNGAVLTCREGLEMVHDEQPILFNDCDHAFICNSFNNYCKEANFAELDGALLTFESKDPCYSYARLDDRGQVMCTVEKKVVSNEAICGAYYFRNKEMFLQNVDSYLEKCEYKEFFVSGIYNEMADRKKVIRTFPTDIHISFGTPNEYDLATNDTRIGALN